MRLERTPLTGQPARCTSWRKTPRRPSKPGSRRGLQNCTMTPEIFRRTRNTPSGPEQPIAEPIIRARWQDSGEVPPASFSPQWECGRLGRRPVPVRAICNLLPNNKLLVFPSIGNYAETVNRPQASCKRPFQRGPLQPAIQAGASADTLPFPDPATSSGCTHFRHAVPVEASPGAATLQTLSFRHPFRPFVEAHP